MTDISEDEREDNKRLMELEQEKLMRTRQFCMFAHERMMERLRSQTVLSLPAVKYTKNGAIPTDFENLKVTLFDLVHDDLVLYLITNGVVYRATNAQKDFYLTYHYAEQKKSAEEIQRFTAQSKRTDAAAAPVETRRRPVAAAATALPATEDGWTQSTKSKSQGGKATSGKNQAKKDDGKRSKWWHNGSIYSCVRQCVYAKVLKSKKKIVKLFGEAKLLRVNRGGNESS